jgi:hypothetical protein
MNFIIRRRGARRPLISIILSGEEDAPLRAPTFRISVSFLIYGAILMKFTTEIATYIKPERDA